MIEAITMAAKEVPKPKLSMPIDPAMYQKIPVEVQCTNCHQDITTRVEDSVRSDGWVFFLCCCLFGSWLTGLLVGCLPGFRKFTHYCPKCKAVLGIGEPSHSCGHVALIIILSLITFAFIFFYIYIKFMADMH